MVGNSSLNRALANKDDEFYTQRSYIENELRHYAEHFRNKIVYCNCDDPTISQFFHYFSYNFHHLQLKKLITTCYRNQQYELFSQHEQESAVKLEYNGELVNGGNVPNIEQIGVQLLESDGDFRSKECIELLKQTDIVVTNPPFSLFRDYIAQLMEYNKKFLIIGNMNAITYANVFPLIKENRIWLGASSSGMKFNTPTQGSKHLGTAVWFTNLDHKQRHQDLILYERYTSEKYPHYDNYDAIEVGKTVEIPMDWNGVMGVPISFMSKYNPEQFEIIGSNRGRDQDPQGVYGRGTFLDGTEVFKRIFIRNLSPQP